MLVVQGVGGKANSLGTRWGCKLHDIDQFKVFQAGSIALRVADNVESIFVLTEVDGEAIGFICPFSCPIGGSDSGLGFGEGLRKIQHR